MSSRKPLIVRIVVKGSPSKPGVGNSSKARAMLMQAFKPKNWPALAAPIPFAVTPGGFVKASFPQSDNRKRGWNSEPEDFQQLVPCMEKALWRVVTEEVLIAARPRARFLTVGVDLNNLGVKARTGEYAHDTHVEMVAVVDTDSGKIVCCTGKSYPVNWQEKTLVQETNLESHLFRWGKKYVLVLGCHDLNMFSNRAYNNQNQKGLRRKRCDKMRKLVKKFKPAIILQHPHSTDSPRIWSTAWSGASQWLPSGHTYASGIAYYREENENEEENEPRVCLNDVLTGTRCCDSHVLDVIVNGYQRD